MNFREKIAHYAAEFLGTLIFVSTAMLAFPFLLNRELAPYIVALTFVAVYFVFNKFGEHHLNPIFTIAGVINKRIKLLDAIAYIFLQFLAAVIGYFIARGMTNLFINYQFDLNQGLYTKEDIGGALTIVTTYGTNGLALTALLEGIFSFALAFIFLGATDRKKSAHSAIAIGLALAAFTLISYQITKSIYHPFKSLAPAIFEGGDALKQSWVFTLIPMLAAVVAGGVYFVWKWLLETPVVKAVRPTAAKAEVTKSEVKKPTARKSARKSTAKRKTVKK